MIRLKYVYTVQDKDDKIIAAIETGKDEFVLNELYKTTYSKIRNFVMKNSGSEEEARDIFQDAVMVFYTQVKAKKYRRETEIDGFIFGVSRNLWFKRFNKKKRIETFEDFKVTNYVENSTYEYVYASEREKVIMGAFKQLGERCEELLINTIYNNMSMKEICEVMGFSTENAAKTKHYKCKQRLIKLVKDNKELKDLLRV